MNYDIEENHKANVLSKVEEYYKNSDIKKLIIELYLKSQCKKNYKHITSIIFGIFLCTLLTIYNSHSRVQKIKYLYISYIYLFIL